MIFRGRQPVVTTTALHSKRNAPIKGRHVYCNARNWPFVIELRKTVTGTTRPQVEEELTLSLFVHHSSKAIACLHLPSLLAGSAHEHCACKIPIIKQQQLQNSRKAKLSQKSYSAGLYGETTTRRFEQMPDLRNFRLHEDRLSPR